MSTPKKIAAAHRRSLKAMKKKLLEMSAQWGDVDFCNERFLEELAGKVQEVSDNLYVEDSEQK